MYCSLWVPKGFVDKIAYNRNFDLIYFTPVASYTAKDYLQKICAKKKCTESEAFYNFIYYPQIIVGIVQKGAAIMITLCVFGGFSQVFHERLCKLHYVSVHNVYNVRKTKVRF